MNEKSLPQPAPVEDVDTLLIILRLMNEIAWVPETVAR